MRFSDEQSDKIYIRPQENDSVADLKKKEKKHEKGFSGIVILAVALFFVFWASVVLLVPYKQWSFDSAYIFETISRNFSELFAFIFATRSAPGIAGKFLQMLCAVTVGAGLASCGAVLQGSFKNQLAGPSTMGVMTGGTLGCLIYLLLFVDAHSEIVNESHSADEIEAYLSRGILETYMQQIFVFAGCILAIMLILGVSLAAGRGKLSGPAMIISGTVFSASIGNITSLIQYYMLVTDSSDERIEEIKDIMLGNFNDITTVRTYLLMAVPILACIVVLLLIRNRLNLLSLGEDEAAVMGMNVGRYRVIMVGISTVITASVVAFCGRIGFLGFMIPIVGRKIAGPNMRYLMPACMLLGSLMLLLVFDVAYFFGMHDSLNVFTSAIGCSFLIITLLRGKKGESGAAFQGRGAAGMGIRP